MAMAILIFLLAIYDVESEIIGKKITGL